MHTSAKDTLYYDGSCPLCSREIKLLGKLTKGMVLFQDIHQYQPETNHSSADDKNHLADPVLIPDKQTMLKVLHLQKADGEWLKGLDANIAVWKHTAYGALFNFFRLPVIRQIAEVAYKKWAEARYQKLYQQDKDGGQRCACEQLKK